MEKHKDQSEPSISEQIQPQLEAYIAGNFDKMRTTVLLGGFSVDTASPTLSDLHALEDSVTNSIGGDATFSYNPETNKFTYFISGHNL